MTYGSVTKGMSQDAGSISFCRKNEKMEDGSRKWETEGWSENRDIAIRSVAEYVRHTSHGRFGVLYLCMLKIGVVRSEFVFGVGECNEHPLELC